MTDYQKLYYSNQEKFLAYKQYRSKTPNNKPGIVFLGGFKSDMEGSKAQAIAEFARIKDYDFIRFDYTGHGNSSENFADGTIGSWLEDTLLIIDSLTQNKPQILVGSSMGGWIMLLAALLRPQKIAGLIGLAAAPDFTENLVFNLLSSEQKELLEKDKLILFSNEFCEDEYPITYNLIENGRIHMLLDKPISLNIPITLIHGMNDEDVPYQTSIEIAEKVISNKVNVHLIKEAGHRLSTKEQLEFICKSIDEMVLGLTSYTD